MKKYLLYLFTFILVFTIQKAGAQKVLLLQQPGKAKRFFYYPGDRITVKLGEPEFIAGGVITYIDDSVCTINKNYTFQLEKVKEVIRGRHFLENTWKKLYATAIIYSLGSIINRGIHSETPLIDRSIPITSGSFVALGTTSMLLRKRHCKMKNNWRLKVLDFDAYKALKNID